MMKEHEIIWLFQQNSIVSTAMPSSIRKLFRVILEDNSY